LGLAQQMEPYIGKYYSHQYMRTKVLHQSEEEMDQIDKEMGEEHQANIKLQQALIDAGQDPNAPPGGEEDPQQAGQPPQQ